MMWFSVDCQLWPPVKYGLCCSMATLSELESALLPFYGKMLPLGGIVWTASKGSDNLTGVSTVQVSQIQVLRQ
jgi:hypothetical protein